IRSGLYWKPGVNTNAPRMTGVSKTTFQNSPQSTSRITLRHQSGPPPCSAPKTSVPALLAALLPDPLILAEPVAASASAASTTPAKSQSLRRCIYSLRSFMGLRPQAHTLRPAPSSGASHFDTQRDASCVSLLGRRRFARNADWASPWAPIWLWQAQLWEVRRSRLRFAYPPAFTFQPVRASAPATTSRISWVISACRARFIARVRLSISSPAFLEALRIAVIWAPCLEAADSSRAR